MRLSHGAFSISVNGEPILSGFASKKKFTTVGDMLIKYSINILKYDYKKLEISILESLEIFSNISHK